MTVLAIQPEALLIHAIPGLRTRVEDLQVLDAVAGQFREGGHDLRCRAALADDEFLVAEVEGLVLAEMEERPGAHHRHGVASGVGLVELGEQHGAFGGKAGRRVQALLAEKTGAVVHRGSIGRLAAQDHCKLKP